MFLHPFLLLPLVLPTLHAAPIQRRQATPTPSSRASLAWDTTTHDLLSVSGKSYNCGLPILVLSNPSTDDEHGGGSFSIDVVAFPYDPREGKNETVLLSLLEGNDAPTSYELAHVPDVAIGVPFVVRLTVGSGAKRYSREKVLVVDRGIVRVCSNWTGETSAAAEKHDDDTLDTSTPQPGEMSLAMRLLLSVLFWAFVYGIAIIFANWFVARLNARADAQAEVTHSSVQEASSMAAPTDDGTSSSATTPLLFDADAEGDHAARSIDVEIQASEKAEVKGGGTVRE